MKVIELKGNDKSPTVGLLLDSIFDKNFQPGYHEFVDIDYNVSIFEGKITSSVFMVFKEADKNEVLYTKFDNEEYMLKYHAIEFNGSITNPDIGPDVQSFLDTLDDPKYIFHGIYFSDVPVKARGKNAKTGESVIKSIKVSNALLIYSERLNQ